MCILLPHVDAAALAEPEIRIPSHHHGAGGSCYVEALTPLIWALVELACYVLIHHEAVRVHICSWAHVTVSIPAFQQHQGLHQVHMAAMTAWVVAHCMISGWCDGRWSSNGSIYWSRKEGYTGLQHALDRVRRGLIKH